MHTKLLLILLTILPSSPLQDAFRQAKQAIRQKNYQVAIELFNDLLQERNEREDEALYWTAYALAKINRTTEAHTLLTQLEERFPKSRWRDDAEALMIEYSMSGRGMDHQNTELKLIALSALMAQDPVRATQALEKFLKGNYKTEHKRRALFVLVQHPGSETGNLIEQIALGQSYPELRELAIEMLGHFEKKYAVDLLSRIYENETENHFKETVLKGLMLSGAASEISTILDREDQHHLRRSAIKTLGIMGANDLLAQHFERERDPELQGAYVDAFAISQNSSKLQEIAANSNDLNIRIKATRALGITGDCNSLKNIYENASELKVQSAALEGMHIAGGCDTILNIARTETHLELKGRAISLLGVLGEKYADDILAIYRQETSDKMKSKALSALFTQGNASIMIDLARAENNPKLKSQAVSFIGMMDSPEAKEFLLELLEEQ